MKGFQSSGCTFYIVDVFAENKFEGNQLAVVICEGAIPDIEMQSIAKEMHFSETVFITSADNYEIRIFTPEVELPFAGHPTIGAAHVFQQEFVKSKIKTLPLNLKIGQIPILFKYKGSKVDKIWMEQKSPEFFGFFAPEVLAEVLSLSEDDVDGRFKIQEVSTGVPTIIVPLKTLNAVQRAKINREKYFNLIKNTNAKSILIFCPETYIDKNDLNVRFFADYYGVPEDPATGSANGCLAAYLVKHRYFGKSEIDIRVEQGYEIGRKSLLHLRAEDREHEIYVSVGGNAIIVAKGTLT